jgi:hypothetical protein
MLLLACVITIVHYTGVYVRVPVLPLYAQALGASPAEIGVIVAAHMTAARSGSRPTAGGACACCSPARWSAR